MGLRRDFLKNTTASNSWMPTRNTITLTNVIPNTTYTQRYSDYFDYSNRDTRYGDQKKWETIAKSKKLDTNI